MLASVLWGRQSTRITTEKQGRDPTILPLGYHPPKDSYHMSHYTPLLKLIPVRIVLLLAAKDTLPDAASSPDNMTVNVTVPF